MRTARWLLSFLLLVSLGVFAQEPNLQKGRFAFNGDYRIEGHRHAEIFSTIDQARYKKLLANQFECVQKPGNLYLCSKYVNETTTSDFVRRVVLNQYDSYRVELYEPYSSSLEINGESYKQWRVSQKIIVNDRDEEGKKRERIFEFANYAWTRGEDKIYPGSFQESGIGYRPFKRDLQIPLTLHEQPSRDIIDSFFVMVQLERQGE